MLTLQTADMLNLFRLEISINKLLRDTLNFD